MEQPGTPTRVYLSAAALTGTGNVALSAVGWKFGKILKGTTWESQHVAQKFQSSGQTGVGGVNSSGPAYDAFGYVRKYCG